MMATTCWCLPDRRTALRPNGYRLRWLSRPPVSFVSFVSVGILAPLVSRSIGPDDESAVTASAP